MKANIHLMKNDTTERIAKIAINSDYPCFVHVYETKWGNIPYVPKGTKKRKDSLEELEALLSEVPSNSEWVLNHPERHYVLQGMKMIKNASKVCIFGKLQTKEFIMNPVAKAWYTFAKENKKDVIFVENDEGWIFSDVEKFHMVRGSIVFYGEKHWKEGENIAMLSTDGLGDFSAMRDMLETCKK